MKTKKRIEQFLFYDYTGIEAHLEKMARQGWLLSRITSFYWEYRRIEPAEIKFTVTYFSGASEFNPHPTEDQQVFLDYCEEAGWKLAAEQAQMQILYSEEKNPVPIETDEAVKLQTIHKAMKKNFIPSSILMLFCVALQMTVQTVKLITDPVDWLSDNVSLSLSLTWIFVGISWVLNLSGYYRWYRRSKASVAEGGSCAKFVWKSRRVSQLLLALAALGLVTWAMLSLQGILGWMSIVIVAVMFLIVAMILALQDIFRKHGMSKPMNMTVTITLCIALPMLLIGGVVFGILGTNTSAFSDEPVRVVDIPTLSDDHVWKWRVYLDELPLTIEDMTGTLAEHEHYSYRLDKQESLLLETIVGSQSAPPDGTSVKELEYKIMDVKFAPLYDLCRKDMLEINGYDDELDPEAQEHWEPVDEESWAADEAYQLYFGDQPSFEDMAEYVIFWGDRIVWISFNWNPTVEEIQVAAQKLADDQ